MGVKIAIATSNGDYVDGHFGATDFFEIYELVENDFEKKWWHYIFTIPRRY